MIQNPYTTADSIMSIEFALDLVEDRSGPDKMTSAIRDEVARARAAIGMDKTSYFYAGREVTEKEYTNAAN